MNTYIIFIRIPKHGFATVHYRTVKTLGRGQKDQSSTLLKQSNSSHPTINPCGSPLGPGALELSSSQRGPQTCALCPILVSAPYLRHADLWERRVGTVASAWEGRGNCGVMEAWGPVVLLEGVVASPTEGGHCWSFLGVRVHQGL